MQTDQDSQTNQINSGEKEKVYGYLVDITTVEEPIDPEKIREILWYAFNEIGYRDIDIHVEGMGLLDGIERAEAIPEGKRI